MWRSKPRLPAFWRRVWKTGVLRLLRSGVTSEPSRADSIVTEWLDSLGASPAQTTPSPASGPALSESTASSGSTCGASFATFPDALATGRAVPEPEALRRTGGADEGGTVAELHRAPSELPLFPPGPADRDGWRELLGAHPHLAPALEPGVRVHVDGLAVVVDAARTDQLRAGGNGVVPLEAACAFVLLARRIRRAPTQADLSQAGSNS